MILDVLDTSGRAVLEAIGAAPWVDDYYLAGGTGLALHLGHRKSYDLDFFTRRPAETLPTDDLVEKVLAHFGSERARVTLRQGDQVHWSIDGTRVSFIGYPFGLQYPLTRCLGAPLADPREIALMKAYALGRRATARDYVDFYYLLRSRTVTVDEVVTQATKKFVLNGEPLFSTRLFLSQLVYTADVEGIDSASRLVLGAALPFSDVEVFLQGTVGEYVRRALGEPSAQEGER